MKLNIETRLMNKMNERSNQASEEHWAHDYIEDFALQFEYYIIFCVENNTKASIHGFEKWFDDWWNNSNKDSQ